MGQLLTDALVIKNETQLYANTATRVGSWMEDAATAIETLPSALAFIDVASGQSTTLIQNEWYRVGADCTVTFQRNGIELIDAGAGIVRYIGETKAFHVSYLVAMTAQSNKIMHVGILKNAETTPILGTEFEQSTGSRTELTLPGQSVITLNSGDEIGVFIKCSNASTNFSLDNLNVIIKEF